MNDCCKGSAAFSSQCTTINKAILFGRENHLMRLFLSRKALCGASQPVIMVRELIPQTECIGKGDFYGQDLLD